MRKFSFEGKLEKTLQKIFEKDRQLYEIVMKKVREIIECEDVEHYKNLRAPLAHLKRVHIRGPFVLIFKYEKPQDKTIFYDLDHHDGIYF